VGSSSYSMISRARARAAKARFCRATSWTPGGLNLDRRGYLCAARGWMSAKHARIQLWAFPFTLLPPTFPNAHYLPAPATWRSDTSVTDTQLCAHALPLPHAAGLGRTMNKADIPAACANQENGRIWASGTCGQHTRPPCMPEHSASCKRDGRLPGLNATRHAIERWLLLLPFRLHHATTGVPHTRPPLTPQLATLMAEAPAARFA